MTIQEGLLNVLNDEDRPLPKRLKIADNAFYSAEVIMHHRELFLLKWLVQTEVSNNNLDAWKQCQTWLSSDCFSELRASDITATDIETFLYRIQEQFKCDDKDILNTLILVVVALLESAIFQNYFRVNPKKYVIFLRNICMNISDFEILLMFLSKHEKIFLKKIVTLAAFHIIFLENFFISFVDILVKYSDKTDSKLFEYLSSILQRNVFVRSICDLQRSLSIHFENGYTEINNFLQILVASLPVKCEQIYSYHAYRLVYDAFCKSCKQNVNTGFHFFAYLLHHLGFACEKLNIPANKSAHFDVALSAVVGMLETMSRNNLTFDEKINEVTLEELLKNVLLCMMNQTMTPMNETCYEMINMIIKVKPLSIEANAERVLVYLMPANNENYTTQYATTVCNVFDVFKRLHRVQSLIAKIIRNLQPLYLEGKKRELVDLEGFSYEGKLTSASEHCNKCKDYIELDSEKIMPDVALLKFCSGTTSMQSTNIGHMFKVFTYYLQELVGEDLVEKSKKDSYVAFMELVIRCMCHYMEQMNIASKNFRKPRVLEKIEQHMDETRCILEKMGNALVGIEHNHNLMRIFLQLSYTWGELKILMEHIFVNDKEEKEEMSEMELSPCNIALLHSYLPSQMWCLIAERISNFGEQSCKKVMEKLWVQKIRHLILSGMDTPTANEHISILIKSITPIEDYYEYLLTDKFASQVILRQIDSKSLIAIAECVMKDATQNAAILKLVMESRPFISALLYNILKKMHKILKKETKGNDCELISCAVFSYIGVNFLEEDVNLEELNVSEFFTTTFEQCEHYKKKASNVNVEKIKGYFTLLKQLPIIFLDKSSQTLMYYYLLAVFLDINENKQDDEAVNLLENILFGVGQAKIISLDNLLPTKVLLNITMNKFNNPISMFGYAFLSYKPSVSNTNQEVLDELTKHLNDDKYMSCLKLLMKYFLRLKNKKMPELIQNVMESLPQLCQALVAHISDKSATNVSECTQILMECLNLVPMTDEIASQLKQYLDIIFTGNNQITQGELALFNFSLSNDNFKHESYDEQMFVVNVAKTLKNADFKDFKTSTLVYLYSITVQLVLQKLNNIDEFKEFLNYSLQRILTSIENPPALTLEMHVWHHIINTQLTGVKSEILMKANEEIILSLYKNTQNCDSDTHERIMDVLINFELQLLQSTQLLLTSTSMDLCYATITQRMQTAHNFETSYKPSIAILESMLKNRQPLVCDRIPVFLQEYRLLLIALCTCSDTNNKQYNDKHFDQMAEYAHLLEKLTVSLCKLKQHVASVAFYVIADIIKEYETITIYPAVKLALNNCLFKLIALCSPHSISSLMRSLSPGSTEIFKMVYDNYKRYHRFTGRV